MENSYGDKIDFKYSIKMSKKIEKNKWLYPTDEFGKFEKGVVDETETDERIVIDLYYEIRPLPSEAKFTNKKPL